MIHSGFIEKVIFDQTLESYEVATQTDTQGKYLSKHRKMVQTPHGLVCSENSKEASLAPVE